MDGFWPWFWHSYILRRPRSPVGWLIRVARLVVTAYFLLYYPVALLVAGQPAGTLIITLVLWVLVAAFFMACVWVIPGYGAWARLTGAAYIPLVTPVSRRLFRRHQWRTQQVLTHQDISYAYHVLGLDPTTTTRAELETAYGQWRAAPHSITYDAKTVDWAVAVLRRHLP